MQSNRDNHPKKDTQQVSHDARLSYFKSLFIQSINGYRNGSSSKINVSGRWIGFARGAHGLKRSSNIEAQIHNADNFDALVKLLYSQVVAANSEFANRDYKKQACDAANYYGKKAYNSFTWGLNSLTSRAGYGKIMADPSVEANDSSENLEGSSELFKSIVRGFDHAIGSGFHGEVNMFLDELEVSKLDMIIGQHVVLRMSILKDNLLQPISKEISKQLIEDHAAENALRV